MIIQIPDFNDPKVAEKVILDFKSLKEHPGWLLFEAIAYANIEAVKNQIIEGVGIQDNMETINRLRDKLNVHKEMVMTPDKYIKELGPQTITQEVNHDPYLTVEDLQNLK